MHRLQRLLKTLIPVTNTPTAITSSLPQAIDIQNTAHNSVSQRVVSLSDRMALSDSMALGHPVSMSHQTTLTQKRQKETKEEAKEATKEETKEEAKKVTKKETKEEANEETKEEAKEKATEETAAAIAREVTSIDSKTLLPEEEFYLDMIEHLLGFFLAENGWDLPLDIPSNIEYLRNNPTHIQQFHNALQYLKEQSDIDPDFKIRQIDFDFLTLNPSQAMNLAKILTHFFMVPPTEPDLKKFYAYISNSKFLRAFAYHTEAVKGPERSREDIYTRIIIKTEQEMKREQDLRVQFLLGLKTPVAKPGEAQSQHTSIGSSLHTHFASNSLFDNKLLPLLFSFAEPSYNKPVSVTKRRNSLKKQEVPIHLLLRRHSF